MLKEYLNTHNISIYSIFKSSGISYSTLNDIVNCKVEIANVKAGIIHSLAKTLGISMDALFELCKNDIVVRSESYDVYGFVEKRNKKLLKLYKQYNQHRLAFAPFKRNSTRLENIASSTGSFNPKDLNICKGLLMVILFAQSLQH